MCLPCAALVGFFDDRATETISTSKNAIPGFVRALAKTDDLFAKWGHGFHRVATIASDALVIRTCRVQLVKRGDHAAVCAARNIITRDSRKKALLQSTVYLTRIIPLRSGDLIKRTCAFPGIFFVSHEAIQATKGAAGDLTDIRPTDVGRT